VIVLYEDDDLLVVDKPAGHAVQKPDDPEIPLLTERLDDPLWVVRGLPQRASGLVVLARRRQAVGPLELQLAKGPPQTWLVGVSSDAIGARTPNNLDRIRTVDARALIRMREQGRQPPLEKRLAKRGVAIAGDRDGPVAPRWMLHRESITFVHRGEPLKLSTEIPAALQRWVDGADVELPDDDQELVARLNEAVERRWALAARDDLDVYRLVHGAGDALPGVELDRYGDFGVLALRSDEAVARRESLLSAAMSLGLTGVYLKLRPKQANEIADTRRQDVAPPQAVAGRDAPDPLVVHEGELHFESRLGDGLSTGLFLDQRDARRWLSQSSQHASVLNLFCYHAAFTVAAIAGGASRTVSVDASGAALAQARRNITLATRGGDHKLVKEDALAMLERSRERFDVIVLDPPSYATTKQSTFRAAHDYGRLAGAALARLRPGGQLLACTNHRGIVRAKFVRELRDAAKAVGARIARTTELRPAVDFPASPGHDPHLKRVIVELDS
jgi:23S rRNA (cytosine1962-C5)-methyltransferase